MVLTIKCRKCRHELIRETSDALVVTDAHGEEYEGGSNTADTRCSNENQNSLWFLKESATCWISDVIAKEEWTKGKLFCPNCQARIGSFDFVSVSKCACGSQVLPAVHLVKSKVDSISQGANPLALLRN